LKIKNYIIFFSIFLIALFSFNQAYAAAPALPTAVQVSPFYWSEDGFGIDILNSYELPLDPYLIPGETTKDSSKEEIINAYLEANSDLRSKIIVSDDDRPAMYVVHILGGGIRETVQVYTFSKFTHVSPPIKDKQTADGVKFILESLPSKDKARFYEEVGKYINRERVSTPYHIEIDIVLGDGTVLQTWSYRECDLTEYSLQTQDSKLTLGFTGVFNSELRDKATFECAGFHFKPEQRDHSLFESDFDLDKFLPNDDNRAQTILVHFSGGGIPGTKTFSDFSTFTPYTTITKTHTFYKHYNVQIPITSLIDNPGDPTGGQPCDNSGQDPLEENPGQGPPDGNPGQDPPCDAPGLEPGPSPVVDPESAGLYVVKSGTVDIPFSVSRQVPGYSFYDVPRFTLESLPSKDKEIIYQGISKYIKHQESLIQPFDIDVEIITGDGTVLQTWDYKKCDVVNYALRLEASLVSYKFTGKLPSEQRDSFTFECDGFEFDSEQRDSAIKDQAPINPIKLAPNDSQRGQTYQVHFLGADFKEKTTFTTFSKYTHISPGIDDIVKSNTGASPQFTLSSLPSKDKEIFYNMIQDWLKEGKPLQPFDVSIDIVSGDSTVLQTWKYRECDISGYVTFLNNNLLDYKYTQEFSPEIRDNTAFNCRGFSFDADQKQLEKNSKLDIKPIDFIPNDSDRVQAFRVHFLGGDIERTTTFMTFSKFIPGDPFDDSRSFILESLPSKDKEKLFKGISRLINKEYHIQQFDVSIDLITGDGTILQTWEYTKCDLTNYFTTLIDNLIFMKFYGGSGPEIMDKYEFDCAGININSEQRDSGLTAPVNPLDFIPNIDDRAAKFQVHFYGGGISTTKSYIFPKFVSTNSPISVPIAAQKLDTDKDKLRPRFLLASLPSTNHAEFYDAIEAYTKRTSFITRFDTSIEVVTGDGTILYAWQYSNCDPSNYSIYPMKNILFLPMSQKYGSTEIREQTLFDCAGVRFYTNEIELLEPDELVHPFPPMTPKAQIIAGFYLEDVSCKEGLVLMQRPTTDIPACVKESSVEKLQEYGWILVDKEEKRSMFPPTIEIPNDDERGMSFVVHLRGAVGREIVLDTFSMFSPVMQVGNTNLLVPGNPLGLEPKFVLESLPSRDKQPLYDQISYQINRDRPIIPLDVQIDLVTGTGEVIQTWGYTDCDVSDYNVKLDENLSKIKYHDKYQEEIIDKTVFDCRGFSFNKDI